MSNRSQSTDSIQTMESDVSMNVSISPSMTMERDLLERMVQTRDEKVITLQRTVNIQKGQTAKLQQTLDDSRLKLRQDQMRSKMQYDSISNERDLAFMQLKALQEEHKKYKDVVFTLNPEAPGASNPAHAKYLKNSGDVNQKSPRSVAQDDEFNKKLSFGTQKRPLTPARMESAHALCLQAQLYDAMNTISALQIQTMSLKKNCDAVVKSLEEDLTDTTTLKHQIEVELMSQLTHIDREKSLMEGQLREEIRNRDNRILKLEAKIRFLEGLEDDDSDDSDEEYSLSVRGESTMSLATVEEVEDKDAEEKVGHDQIKSLPDVPEQSGKHKKVEPLRVI